MIEIEKMRKRVDSQGAVAVSTAPALIFKLLQMLLTFLSKHDRI